MGESERKILGVLIPTAEECAKYKRVGILGTLGTINSNTFPKEIKKIDRNPSLWRRGGGGDLKEPPRPKGTLPQKGGENHFVTVVFQNAAPMLVPLIEEGEKILAVRIYKKIFETIFE